MKAQVPLLEMEEGTVSLPLTRQEWLDIITALDVLAGCYSEDIQRRYLRDCGIGGKDRRRRKRLLTLIHVIDWAQGYRSLGEAVEIKRRGARWMVTGNSSKEDL